MLGSLRWSVACGLLAALSMAGCGDKDEGGEESEADADTDADSDADTDADADADTDTDPATEDCGDGADNDEDGLVDCYDKDCAAEDACDGEFSCDDGEDNDGDKFLDCNDQDCAAWPTCYESDCQDGVDNDSNGATDCDDDLCAAEDVCFGACAEGGDLGSAVGDAVASGSTVGQGDGFNPTYDESACTSSESSEDVAYTWEVPADGSYVFDTSGADFDTVLRLYAACDGAEVSCNDQATFGGEYTNQSLLCLEGLTAGAAYILVVDGWDTSTSGSYVLDINATDACVETDCTDGLDDDSDENVDCEDSDCFYEAECYEADCSNDADDDADGDTDCDDSDCAFEAGCYESDCSDGDDNDLDGLTDCADAEDCYWSSDCEETDCSDGIDDEVDGYTDCDDSDCAADASCQEVDCADGADDDGNGLVDCDDPDCSFDASCPDSCEGNDLGSDTGDGVVTGSNSGEDDSVLTTCALSTGGLDVVFTWQAPSTGCYTLDTQSSDYDTVLAVYDTCGGSELACNEDVDASSADYTSLVELDATEGDTYIIVLDAYMDYSTGTYILDINEGC